MTAAQIAFEFPRVARDPAETFVAGPGTAAARAALEGWRAWPTRTLALIGPPDSGKSHLAALWARAGGPEDDAAAVFAAASVGAELPAALAQLERGGRVVLEDADQADHDSLFSVINAARRGGGALLLTARAEPAHWPAGAATSDLRSRLAALPVAWIETPDDAEARALLAKLFADEGVHVDEGLLSYVCVRIERSHAALAAAAAALSRRALAGGARVTRALARAHFHDDERGDA